jgi:hypothetical protein
VDALFRYADEGTFVSWRAFRDDTKAAPPVFIASTSVPALDAIAELARTAMEAATDAATRPEPSVFCPPIATFSNPHRAREIDLANGLALSVECDSTPAHARETLEAILGPATVVVSSGGITAAGEPKLHLHWRLAEPTSATDEHARLKRARILATAIVGGDATNVPAVHPIRWPGSWHRKGEPRLATIVALDLDREIILSDALEQLEQLAPSITRPTQTGVDAMTGEVASADALMGQVLSGTAMHAPLVALAYRLLSDGMTDGRCVVWLRGLMNNVPVAQRGGHERWEGHYNDIPRTVRTAREKVDLREPAPQIDISGFVQSITAPNIIAVRKRDVAKEIPAHLLEPPGILGAVAKYGVESAVRPVPIFAVQAALALGSIVCGRRYMSSQRNYSSLYFLNVAKSGTGKEEAKRTVERILSAAGARRLLGPSSYSSGNAVFSALLKKPQHIAIVDEFGKFLEAASSTRDTFKQDALTQLMEAFGRVDHDMTTPQFSTMTLGASAAANHEPKVIARPAITLLAMTTPSTFYATMRSTRIMDGFLNRILVVEHQGPRLPMADWKDVPVPDRVIEWVKQLLAPHGDLDVGGQTDTIGAPRVVEFSQAAFSATKAFETEMIALAVSLEREGLDDIVIRSREIAMRLALILAMGDAPDTPMITLDCVEWAQDYVRFFLDQTIDALRQRVSDSATERIRNTILTAIRDAGERGVSNKEIHRGKLFIGIPKRDRADAIESLMAAELVMWSDIQTGGRPRKALVALAENAGVDESDSVVSKVLELAS